MAVRHGTNAFEWSYPIRSRSDRDHQGLCAARPETMVWYRVPIADSPHVESEIQTSFLSDNSARAMLSGKENLIIASSSQLASRLMQAIG